MLMPVACWILVRLRAEASDLSSDDSELQSASQAVEMILVQHAVGHPRRLARERHLPGAERLEASGRGRSGNLETRHQGLRYCWWSHHGEQERHELQKSFRNYFCDNGSKCHLHEAFSKLSRSGCSLARSITVPT